MFMCNMRGKAEEDMNMETPRKKMEWSLMTSELEVVLSPGVLSP